MRIDILVQHQPRKRLSSICKYTRTALRTLSLRLNPSQRIAARHTFLCFPYLSSAFSACSICLPCFSLVILCPSSLSSLSRCPLFSPMLPSCPLLSLLFSCIFSCLSTLLSLFALSFLASSPLLLSLLFSPLSTEHQVYSSARPISLIPLAFTWRESGSHHHLQH